MLSFVELPSFATIRDKPLVTMYSKNVREDIDPRLLRRIKEEFERG
jgi:hypothetical protein